MKLTILITLVILSASLVLSTERKSKLKKNQSPYRKYSSKYNVDYSDLKDDEEIHCRDICIYFCEEYVEENLRRGEEKSAFSFHEMEESRFKGKLKCRCTNEASVGEKFRIHEKTLEFVELIKAPTIGYWQCKKHGSPLVIKLK